MRFKKCLLILFGLTLLSGCMKLDTFVMDVDLSNEYTEPKDEFTYVSAVSYANWANNDAIIDKAINQTELQISSACHLPIYKMDSLEKLDQFVDDFDEILTLDNGYNEVPSFLEVTSEYDEAFFENNTLFVVYVSSTTGSERFDVKDVIIENSRLRVHVEQTNNPEIVTEDMAGWFMIVEIKDEHISDCEYFDAIFGGIEKEEVMKHKSEKFIFYKTDVDKLPMDTHNIKGVYQSKLDENTGYMTYTDARYHSLFIGQVLTLFGNADDITDNYEDLVSYVVAAEKEDGTIIYLEVYYGPSGPAIGGLDTEDYLLAAQELEQLIMSAKASDYEIKIEYEDLDVVFKMGVKNGVPYYG